MGEVMRRAGRVWALVAAMAVAGCAGQAVERAEMPSAGAGNGGAGRTTRPGNAVAAANAAEQAAIVEKQGAVATSPGAKALLAAAAAAGGPGPGAVPVTGAPGDTRMEADFRKIINAAKAKVFPAVVFIRVVQQNYESGVRSNQEVSGSGVVISADGEVLTNWHVVDKAVEVRCLLFNGQAYEAKVLGSDKDIDLALLKLGKPLGDGAELAKTGGFPHAKIGDSEALEEGDFVMAMGAPWGLSRSVSLGIISCTKRYLPSTSEYSIWLQTDAAISPGNSGGPLVNSMGEVVGINTRGGMEGGELGFAGPSSTIVPIVAQLRQSGKVDWSWLGLQLQPLKDFNRNVYFEGTQGVIIAETDPDSPARQAGLQSRDRILSVDGRAVAALTDEDLPEVRRIFGLLPRSKPVTLQVMRGDRPVTLSLTPREKGKVEGEALALSRWDCTAKVINQFDNPDLYFHKKQGVFVYGLKYPGNAQASGLQSEDILLKVEDTPVTTLEDLKAAHEKTLKSVRDKPRVMLTVLRNGLMRQVVMDISRDRSKE
jgi:serine protease Do